MPSIRRGGRPSSGPRRHLVVRLMTDSHRLPHLAAAAAALLALGLGACGGDDDARDAPAGTDAPAATDSPASGGQAASADRVAIVEFTYEPEAVRVKAGTEVTWTNEDSFAHTVTADDGSFDSKNMDKGATFSHRFDTPGTFKYFCAIHNYMTGSVVID